MIKRKEGRINTDYGMKDYYKYYSKNTDTPVDSKKYNKVVSEFNKAIVDMIINQSLEFTPPKIQLTFCIRKYIRVPRIKDNKLVNATPIDWKTTNELNKDSEGKKIIVRFLNNHTSKYVFRIKAIKSGNYYTNKKLYRFKAARSFQRDLAKRILDKNKDNFEAYNMY